VKGGQGVGLLAADEVLLFIRRDVEKVLKVVCHADLGFFCLMSSCYLAKEFVK